MLVWHILASWKPDQRGWGTVLYAWNPVALIEFASLGHNDVMMLTLLLAAVLLARKQRWRWAVVGLVAAALVEVDRGDRAATVRAAATAHGTKLARASLASNPDRRAGAGHAGAAAPAVWPACARHPRAGVTQSRRKPKTRWARSALPRRGAWPAGRAWPTATIRNYARTLEAAVGWASKALFGLGILPRWPQCGAGQRSRAGCKSACWLLVLVLIVAPVFRVWYAAWPLALAALLGWRRAEQLAFAFGHRTAGVFALGARRRHRCAGVPTDTRAAGVLAAARRLARPHQQPTRSWLALKRPGQARHSGRIFLAWPVISGDYRRLPPTPAMAALAAPAVR